jgi:hypothetical protein
MRTPLEVKQMTSKQLEKLLGFLIWVLVIASIVFLVYVQKDEADVLLNAVPGNNQITGTITFEGERISGGVVELSVRSIKEDRQLGSIVSPVEGNGTFIADVSRLFPKNQGNQGLQVAARFTGLWTTGTGKSQEKKPLSGEAVTYVNASGPKVRQAEWVVVSFAAVLLFLLIVLFTGEIRRRKARVLFSTMYFVTFLSLFVPIVMTIWVSTDGKALTLMADSPVGLVRASARGIAEPQWLVNVGGTVAKGNGNPPWQVKGGLAVPFYVILLAMLGAGINMTRRIPEIQAKYDTEGLSASEFGAMNVFGLLFGGKSPSTIQAADRVKTAGIRTELVRNFMFVLSAPFLAIAMYYVLQVIATEVAQPVLVIMAFATGLVSDKVVGFIVDFAGEHLGGKEGEEGEQTKQLAGAENGEKKGAGKENAAPATGEAIAPITPGEEIEASSASASNETQAAAAILKAALMPAESGREHSDQEEGEEGEWSEALVDAEHQETKDLGEDGAAPMAEEAAPLKKAEST